MKRIFLIGYMGSGKTSMGVKLAENLGLTFVDMDHYIEQKYHKTISQIFEESGQDAFRKIEHNCLHEVAEFEDCVIATGGGAPCFFDNMEFMNHRGLTVFLNLSTEQLAQRLENSRAGKRPLIANKKGDELRQFISEGLSNRISYYLKSKVSVSGTDDEILKNIEKAVANFFCS